MTADLSGSESARTQPGITEEPHFARLLALPAAAQAAGIARQATRAALTTWRMEHVQESAVLLVSELVTNVVLHAQTFATFMMLRLETVDAFLRIEVQDADPSWPQPRTPDGLDESGFGFLIVDELADKWGVRETPSGKAVWAELDTRPGSQARITTDR
jgi:serine/threonine-protein kinase RsbW